jgi:hypothetical protein
MRQRCLNPRSPAFANYGERGILIYPPWIDSFETFLADVGPRPSGMYSLDRIDVNGHYEPGNVRWATRSQQAKNRRHVGRTQEWAVRNPEAWEAKRAIFRAIEAGQLSPLDHCEECQAVTYVVAYHPDPRRHFDIVWLCSWCRYRVWCVANGRVVPERRVRRLPAPRSARAIRTACAGQRADGGPCPWRGRHRGSDDAWYCAMHWKR